MRFFRVIAMTSLRFAGIDTDQLKLALDRGTDHAGNTIETFVDPDGEWPLRCCLTDSAPGEEIAIIAWSPFQWKGAYAETGPVVVHAVPCPGPATDATLPSDFDSRPMVLRPYGFDQRIAYHHVRHIAEGESLTAHVAELLDENDVDFVHARNVTGGCFAFAAVAARD